MGEGSAIEETSRDCRTRAKRTPALPTGDDLSHGHAIFLDFMENTNSGAATSASPTKNITSAAKWRSEIHEDRAKEMSDDRPGTNKKTL